MTSLEPGAHELVLDDGERIGYDAVVLATGSEPRRLEVPGAELDGVHVLRTHANSDSIAAGFRGSADIVVIGAGWIGCEVAASARSWAST